MSPLQGLKKILGDIIPRALPWAGLFCPFAEDGFAIAGVTVVRGGDT
jgi:hypothetical protein